MLLGLPHPAQIFGLVQMQSKRNLSVQNALQRNSVLQKSSYVDWASNYPRNSTFPNSSYIHYKSTEPNAVLNYM